MIPDLAPPAAKAGRSDVRRRNKWLLLHLIQTDGPSSQAELARRSGLSPASVRGILQPLIRKRILAQERKSTSGRGRKATIPGFNPRTTLTAGVSIDQEECEVALADLSARVVDRASATYPRYTEPHEAVALAVFRIQTLAKRNRVDSLIGAGVALPGLIDSGSSLVWAAANLG
jgi:predicted transcriptional regulator